MTKPLAIARQSAAPTGWIGRLVLRLMAMETRRFNEAVLANVDAKSGERILEVGFGHGRTLDRAARATPDATFAGIDTSTDALRVARRRCRRWIEQNRMELVAGDAAALPWPKASFDTAFCVHVLYFWSDPAQCLRELARVLRGDGRLVIGYRRDTPEGRAKLPSSIYRLYSIEDVVEMLATAGFAVEDAARSNEDLRIAVARKRSDV